MKDIRGLTLTQKISLLSHYNTKFDSSVNVLSHIDFEYIMESICDRIYFIDSSLSYVTFMFKTLDEIIEWVNITHKNDYFIFGSLIKITYTDFRISYHFRCQTVEDIVKIREEKLNQII